MGCTRSEYATALSHRMRPGVIPHQQKPLRESLRQSGLPAVIACSAAILLIADVRDIGDCGKVSPPGFYRSRSQSRLLRIPQVEDMDRIISDIVSFEDEGIPKLSLNSKRPLLRIPCRVARR